ncbi:MAG: type II secretion system protein GspD [Spirochaetia bacterium]|nr:type II secretion system protein GspD [Spirochaetia bacterium]
MYFKRFHILLALFLLLTVVEPIFLNSAIWAKKEKLTKKNSFRADFRDKDIMDFLKAMSGLIGKNIIADEKLKGKITVISPERIPKDMAYNYMTAVLALKGFGVVKDGEILTIVPLKDAIAIEQDIHFGREPLPEDWLKDNKVVTAILPVYSGKPSRLAGLLKRVTGAETQLIDYDELEMMIILGSALEVNRLLNLVVKIDPEEYDKPKDEEEDPFSFVHIYRMENMEADKIEATLRKMRIPELEEKNDATGAQKTAPQKGGRPPVPARRPTVPQGGGSQNSKQIDIISHKESNTLIFIGEAEEWAIVKKLIKKLDIKRDQVLLEVLIVEVSADATNSFGIDWQMTDPAFAQFNSGLAYEGGIVSEGTGGDVVLNPFNTLLGFSLGFLNKTGASIWGLLNANINRKNFAILSAPQVLTLDNQEAEINVGEDVPIVTGTRLAGGTGTDAVANYSYDYRSVGIKLKFTPQINQNKEITLDLFQEVKAISTPAGDVTQNPSFKKRDIKTVVRVKDEQTIVIGGLVSTDKQKNIRKIPILGDIPILGYLFKRTSTELRRTNLLVFITPHILTSRKVADAVTNQAIESQKNSQKK